MGEGTLRIPLTAVPHENTGIVYSQDSVKLICSCGFSTAYAVKRNKTKHRIKAETRCYKRWFLHLTEMKIRGLLIN